MTAFHRCAHIIREIPGVDGSSPARRRRGPAGDGQDGFGGPDLRDGLEGPVRVERLSRSEPGDLRVLLSDRNLRRGLRHRVRTWQRELHENGREPGVSVFLPSGLVRLSVARNTCMTRAPTRLAEIELENEPSPDRGLVFERSTSLEDALSAPLQRSKMVPVHHGYQPSVCAHAASPQPMRNCVELGTVYAAEPPGHASVAVAWLKAEVSVAA